MIIYIFGLFINKYIFWAYSNHTSSFLVISPVLWLSAALLRRHYRRPETRIHHCAKPGAVTADIHRYP